MTAPPLLQPQRIVLARAALGAALATPGVVRGDSGPAGLIRTADPDGTLHGVTATAEGGGRYSVELRLVTRLVALPRLDTQIRARIDRAVAAAALADCVGAIDIHFAAVETAGDLPEEQP